MSASQSGRGEHRAVLSLLFFLSGAAGLTWQVLWFKRFAHAWGNSSLALAAVLAAFLAGLGAGAALGGRLADRLRRPLFAYGVAEVAVGLLALAVPAGIRIAARLECGFYARLLHAPLALAAVRCALALAILLLPCAAMGATLPLLVKRWVGGGIPTGASCGWLYALNALGAAAGCAAAGFWLLPAFGIELTSALGAGGNLAIGVAACALGIRAGSGAETGAAAAAAAESATPALAWRPSRSAIALAAALSGLGALSLEVVWARWLAVILGGSTYAFTSMLTVVLLGIGAGSLIAPRLSRRGRTLRWTPVVVLLAIIVTTALGQLAVGALAWGAGLARPLRVGLGGNAAVSLVLSGVLELLPAMGMGLLFPLLVALLRARPDGAGRAVGLVYVLNTSGTIAGAVATSLFFIPSIGLSGTAALAAGFYTVALLALSPPLEKTRSALAFFLATLVASGAVFVASGRADPLITDMGSYLYGSQSIDPEKIEIARFEEGRSANVLVTRQGSLHSLRINGKVEASDAGDMPTQLGVAFFPLFHRPEAKDILAIGLGSGSTSGAALLFPETRVTCCEIEPAVARAAGEFSARNHRPLDSPRFDLVLDDARSYLHGMARELDIILSEPSNPWLTGVSSLFTREFYELARSRLREDGILAQWIQCYSLSAAEYATIVRTVLSVFEEARLVRISKGDTILLASRSPLDPVRESLAAAQALVNSTPDLAADISSYFGTRDVATLLLTREVLGREDLRGLGARGGSTGLSTDSNLRLEYETPLRLFDPEANSGGLSRAILAVARPEWFEEHARALGAGSDQAGAFLTLAELFEAAGREDLARELTRLGRGLDPEDAALRAEELLLASSGEKGKLDPALLDALLDRGNEETYRLGLELARRKRWPAAAAVLERLARELPRSATAQAELARVRHELGDEEAARSALEQAVELDPLSDAVEKARREMGGESSARGSKSLSFPREVR